MKEILIALFDLAFPRREDDARVRLASPEELGRTLPHPDAETYPDVWTLLPYQDPIVKSAIKELKSHRSMHGTRIAAHALAQFIVGKDLANATFVPIPITKRRRKKRGYNQCELLLETLKKEFIPNLEIRADLLERPIDRDKFALAGRSYRLAAASGIFRAPVPLSTFKDRIIVIDDVVTTGSTMAEAIHTLRAAGARGVSGIGIAH